MAFSAPSGYVETSFDPLIAEKLAAGILSNYQPPVEDVQKHLKEICMEQKKITDQLEKERKRVGDPTLSKELLEMYSQIKKYTGKLVVLKKDMEKTTEKAAQLKVRALKLVEGKQNEALLKEMQRETQLQHEQELIAKPTTSSKSPSP